MSQNDLIDAAMRYASQGWRVVPCDLESKHPPLKEWQKLATTDEDQIIEWFAGRYSGCGVSIVFGPESGVIDIDTDNVADGDKLRDLAFGGEWPITITYLSGKRKTPHRLFRWRDDLPDKANIDLRKYAGLDIDVKLGAENKGSHSVAPPSRGYEWIPGLSPDECEPAELPDSFIAWLFNLIGAGVVGDEKVGKSIGEWVQLAAGAAEGSRNDSLTSILGGLVRNLRDIDSKSAVEQLYGFGKGINQNNRPPLPDAEVRRSVESVIRMERKRRASEAIESFGAAAVGAGEGGPQRDLVAIVKVIGDPVTFELTHPAVAAKTGKPLRLSASDLLSVHRIKVRALEQAAADLKLPAQKAWPDVLAKLLEVADERQGDRETDRMAVVAQAVQERVDQARVVTEGDGMEPAANGYPSKLSNGAIAIGRGHLMTELGYDPRKVSQQEISRLMTAIGGQKKKLRVKMGRLHAWSFTPAAVQKLDELAWPENGPEVRQGQPGPL